MRSCRLQCGVILSNADDALIAARHVDEGARGHVWQFGLYREFFPVEHVSETLIFQNRMSSR